MVPVVTTNHITVIQAVDPKQPTGLDRLQRNLRQTVSHANIAITPLPLVPEISLFLLDQNYPRGPLPHEDMIATLNDPAYWAFCWASGQVMARWLIDHGEIARDRIVLDFGTGSGVAGIAAAMTGASEVIACDIDPMALCASEANGTLNGCELTLLADVHALDTQVDLILAADVLYDRDNIPWLEQLAEISRNILLADSRMKDVEPWGYRRLLSQFSTTVPDLDEASEFNDVKLYVHEQGVFPGLTGDL